MLLAEVDLVFTVGMEMIKVDGSRRVLVLIGLFGVFTAPAKAAPFCVETTAIPPQCLYFDAASCNVRAAQMGGQCMANPAELHISSGPGRFCLITSGRVVSCVYADRGTCDTEAHRQQGACVEQPNRPESPGPDPYRNIRPSMAGGGG
jgi:hypothetical protein